MVERKTRKEFNKARLRFEGNILGREIQKKLKTLPYKNNKELHNLVVTTYVIGFVAGHNRKLPQEKQGLKCEGAIEYLREAKVLK